MKDSYGYNTPNYQENDELLVTKAYNILLDLYNFMFEFEEPEDLEQEDLDRILEDILLAINYLEGYGG